MYGHQGAIWDANESKEVWYQAADRFMKLIPPGTEHPAPVTSELLEATKKIQGYMDHHLHCSIQNGGRKCTCGFAARDTALDAAISNAEKTI